MARSRSPEEVEWDGFSFGSGGVCCCCEYARREGTELKTRDTRAVLLDATCLALRDTREEEANVEGRWKAVRREWADMVNFSESYQAPAALRTLGRTRVLSRPTVSHMSLNSYIYLFYFVRVVTSFCRMLICSGFVCILCTVP